MYVSYVTGFLEFAGVVIWKIAFAFPTYAKILVTRDKPLELTVHQVFHPTALMVSSILALLAALLLYIDVFKASIRTSKIYLYVYKYTYKCKSRKRFSEKKQ